MTSNDQDLSQITYIGDWIRCSDGMPGEHEGTVPSSYNADNDFFEDYIGPVLGRGPAIIYETTVRRLRGTNIIYETTLTIPLSGGTGGSNNDPPLSLPPPSPSPSPPPPSPPSALPRPSPSPPPPPSASTSHSLPPSASTSHSLPPSPSSPPPPPPPPLTSPSPSPSLSSSSSPSSSPPPFLPSPLPTPTQRKLSNLGPIVGGIVGGILILILLVLLLLFYCHRRRLSKNMVNPFPSHLNQGPNDYMVMLVPPPTKEYVAGSSSSPFTSSSSLPPVEPLQHADSGIRDVNPVYVLPISQVELPPAYTRA